jgi:Right handed beta helix region
MILETTARPGRVVVVSGAGRATGAPSVNAGADFGPDTAGTLTNGLQEAIDANPSKIVLRGTFVQGARVVLRANTWIDFEHCTLRVGPSFNGPLFGATNAATVRITGDVEFIGTGGGPANFFSVNGRCNDWEFDWNATLRGLSQAPVRYLIVTAQAGGLGGQGLRLKGSTITDGSAVIHTADTSNVEVSGVRSQEGGMTSAAGDAICSAASSGAAGTTHDISYHDIFLDGGRIPGWRTGLLRIVADIGRPSIRTVSLVNCTVRNNTPNPSQIVADGVDINRCQDVTVSNVSVDNIGGDGIAVVASHSVVSNCQARDCGYAGISIGDNNYQTEDISDCRVVACVVSNCSRAIRSVYAGGSAVSQTGRCTVSRVTIKDCTSQDTTGSSQRFGLSIAAGTGGTGSCIVDVQVEGGTFHGYERDIYRPG